jgi:hypothetical protein
MEGLDVTAANNPIGGKFSFYLEDFGRVEPLYK